MSGSDDTGEWKFRGSRSIERIKFFRAFSHPFQLSSVVVRRLRLFMCLVFNLSTSPMHTAHLARSITPIEGNFPFRTSLLPAPSNQRAIQLFPLDHVNLFCHCVEAVLRHADSVPFSYRRLIGTSPSVSFPLLDVLACRTF